MQTFSGCRRSKTLAASLLSALLFLGSLVYRGIAADTAGGDASSSILDLNLYAPDLKLVDLSAAGAKATGSMPAGWWDDSNWADLKVNYRLADEDGQKYLAISLSDLKSGYAALRHPLPNFSDGSLFKLEIKARGSSNNSIEFGAREAAAPWAFMWSQKQTLDGGWRDYDYIFKLDHNTLPMGFWLNMKDAGEIDIASIHLEKISQAKLLSDLQKKYPGPPPQNVLRTSRLPLGLQSGWAVDPQRLRNNLQPYDPAHPLTNRDPIAEPDPEVKGVSGSPALHIVASDNMALWSEPFAIPLAMQKYTGSVYVKGVGKGILQLMEGDRKFVAHVDFTATADWTRVEVPFEPRLGAKMYNLRVDVFRGGSIWLDAWQVGPGEKAGPYTSQLPEEVSLACVAKDTAAQRIQFEDEPAQVQYCVTGNPSATPQAGLRLQSRVVNLYGETANNPAVDLPTGAIDQGRINIGLFPNHPLGALRVEAWVEDSKGARVSAYQEVVIHRIHRPHYWGQDAPNSPFGIHVDADALHVTMAKAVGMNWVRSHDAGNWWSGWYYLEREPGKLTFADDAINRYRQAHLKIMATLVTTPTWDSYFAEKHNAYFDTFYEPKDFNQYAGYVQSFAQHYKGKIDCFDIWNEPWNAAWFAHSFDNRKKDRAGYQPSPDSPGDYSRLEKLAYQTLKAVDPKITVVGINTTGTDKYDKTTPDIIGRDWSLCLNALKADENCDVIGYHQYSTEFMGYPNDLANHAYDVAVGPFQARGVDKPVWMTEGSPTTGLSASGFYHYTLPYVDSENVLNTGNHVCRFFVSILANHVSKAFLFSMASYEYFGEAQINPYMGLVTEEGALHPSGDAFSAMAWELEDTKFKKWVDLGKGNYACLFSGTNRSIAVILPAENKAHFELPTGPGWKIIDMLGNPTDGQVTSNHLLYMEAAASSGDLEQALNGIKGTP